MSVDAVTVIQLLQKIVAEHGEDSRIAVAASRDGGAPPSRLEIVALAVDHQIRRPDEPARTGPPLVWLFADALDGDGDAPPRHATVRADPPAAPDVP